MRSVSLHSVALVGFLAAPQFLSSSPVSASEHLREGDHYGYPTLILSNDVIELTVLEMGGGFASLLLKEDPKKMNPLWDSIRDARETGQSENKEGMDVGHFICVDGFGPPSPEERAAGMLNHGEAHTLTWVTRSSEKEGDTATLVQEVYLPRVQEILTRSLTMVDGENVVYVHSTLESLLSFDRPVCWAEHATIGSPFLEPGVTVVDMSGNRAITRAHEERLPTPRRLAPDREFTWPMAPAVDGGTVDMRTAPETRPAYEWSAYRWDPDREFAWVTALHPRERLLLGYVFKSSEFPWMQLWEYYPPEGVLARGLEFGTQMSGKPRRDVITQNRFFGQLLYRWLPAKSEIESSYVLFWTRTPEGFQGVDDIQIRDGKLHITDSRSGSTLDLELSQSF